MTELTKEAKISLAVENLKIGIEHLFQTQVKMIELGIYNAEVRDSIVNSVTSLSEYLIRANPANLLWLMDTSTSYRGKVAEAKRKVVEQFGDEA
jgi:hypothetical protein